MEEFEVPVFAESWVELDLTFEWIVSEKGKAELETFADLHQPRNRRPRSLEVVSKSLLWTKADMALFFLWLVKRATGRNNSRREVPDIPLSLRSSGNDGAICPFHCATKDSTNPYVFAATNNPSQCLAMIAGSRRPSRDAVRYSKWAIVQAISPFVV